MKYFECILLFININVLKIVMYNVLNEKRKYIIFESLFLIKNIISHLHYNRILTIILSQNI